MDDRVKMKGNGYNIKRQRAMTATTTTISKKISRPANPFGLHSFGQEFYPHESIRAIKLAHKLALSDRATLMRHIAESLPQPGAQTRERIATKFIQRYFNDSRRVASHKDEGAPQCGLFDTGEAQTPKRTTAQTWCPAGEQPFVRLVARCRHVPTQIELLFWRLARVDALVGALARELFYPICVQNRAPDGLSRVEFSARNGGQLFSVAPQVTRAFIFFYAETVWNFHDRASLDRALRILQSAGLIARQRMMELRGRPTAFCLREHNISTATFIFALYDEFLPHLQPNPTSPIERAEYADAVTPDLSIARGVLPISDFARTFLLSPAQIEEHCETARRHQLIAQQGDSVRLLFGDLDALVEALLSKAI